jgi:hypothetical protein
MRGSGQRERRLRSVNQETICFMAETKFECRDCGKKVCNAPDEVCSKCKKSGEKQDISEVLKVLNPDEPLE